MNRVFLNDNLTLVKELAIQRKYLVFVNPFGGQGRALKMWKENKYMFDESNIDIRLVETKYKNHAYDFILEQDLSGYSGIICVSGDGILHEVVNGVFHKGNGEYPNQIPIGVIPGGIN